MVDEFLMPVPVSDLGIKVWGVWPLKLDAFEIPHCRHPSAPYPLLPTFHFPSPCMPLSRSRFTPPKS